jgi:hypothetical protein
MRGDAVGDFFEKVYPLRGELNRAAAVGGPFTFLEAGKYTI